MRQQLLCRYIPQQRSTKTQLAHSNKNFNNSFVSLLHFLLSMLHARFLCALVPPLHGPPIARLLLSNAHLGAPPLLAARVDVFTVAGAASWPGEGARAAAFLQLHDDRSQTGEKMNFICKNISIFPQLKYFSSTKLTLACGKSNLAFFWDLHRLGICAALRPCSMIETCDACG
jgi:hypothetical protein